MKSYVDAPPGFPAPHANNDALYFGVLGVGLCHREQATVAGLLGNWQLETAFSARSADNLALVAAYAAETTGFLPPADLEKVVHDVELWRSYNAAVGGPLACDAMELGKFETEEDELE